MFSLSQLMKFSTRLFFSVGVVWGLYFLRDNLWFRAYPLVICVITWLAFSLSLLKGRRPLIVIFAESIAKTSNRKLSDAEKIYCYHLTIAWVIFMTVHVGVTCASLFLSHAFWVWYNGCVTYVLMGGMFLIGLIIQKWRKFE